MAGYGPPRTQGPSSVCPQPLEKADLARLLLNLSMHTMRPTPWLAGQRGQSKPGHASMCNASSPYRPSAVWATSHPCEFKKLCHAA
jgi:hypothetical protein